MAMAHSVSHSFRGKGRPLRINVQTAAHLAVFFFAQCCSPVHSP